MSTLADSQVTIRPSRVEDSAKIRRLAALDSSPVPRGGMLLGELDGRLVAAVSLADGRAIADPFIRTRTLVEVLRTAAAPLEVAS